MTKRQVVIGWNHHIKELCQTVRHLQYVKYCWTAGYFSKMKNEKDFKYIIVANEVSHFVLY